MTTFVNFVCIPHCTCTEHGYQRVSREKLEGDNPKNTDWGDLIRFRIYYEEVENGIVNCVFRIPLSSLIPFSPIVILPSL